jgi:hypothetical protein
MDEVAPEPPPPPKKKKRWPFYLLLSIILILGAAVIIPNYVKARVTVCKNACINNLRQLDGAKEQFALEKKLPAGHIITAQQEILVYQYVKGGQPKCPGGGGYKLNPIGAAPTCDSLKEGGHFLFAQDSKNPY